jgi:hypothetical protein
MNPAVMTTGPGVIRRDGVEELGRGEPVMLVDHALAQERHDGQAGAKHERPGLGEEQPERDQHPAAGGGAERGGQQHR